jgi:hypothetical protein
LSCRDCFQGPCISHPLQRHPCSSNVNETGSQRNDVLFGPVK